MQNKPIEHLDGVIPALITPMKYKTHIDKPIDSRKLEALIYDLLHIDKSRMSQKGVSALLACGTTGQSATLGRDEHIGLAHHIVSVVAGEVPVMVSAGSNNTNEAIYLQQSIENRVGPTTFLHVTGYYNCPPQEGLIAHYITLAESLEVAGSNIVLYNVPSRTNSLLHAETVAQLADHDKIIGMKDATGNLEYAQQIIDLTRDKAFTLMSGDDSLVAELMQKGYTGVISAAANVCPKMMLDITEVTTPADALELQQRTKLVIDAVYRHRNPIMLAHFFNSDVRLPLVKMEDGDSIVEDIRSRFSSRALGIDLDDYR